MADISTTVAGIKMRSPIGVASLAPLNWWYPAGPLQKIVDWHKRCIDYGAGFVYTPSSLPGDEPNPIRQYKIGQYVGYGDRKRHGYYLCCPEEVNQSIKTNVRFLEALKKAIPAEIPIVASLIDPKGRPEAYADLARQLESAGADMLEVNGGCPLSLMERPEEATSMEDKYGVMLGASAALVGPIVQAIADAVKIPVGFKLTPQAGFPGLMGVVEACVNAGAKFVQTTHYPLAIGPIDIYNGGKPLWPILKEVETNQLTCAGGSDPIRVSSNFYTACTAMFFPRKIDIWAGGGLVTGEHLVESIMYGAICGQTASGVMFLGTRQIGKIISFLSKFMDDHGYKTINDFRGIALKYIKPIGQAVNESRKVRLAAEVDASKCAGCGICADTICPAIDMEHGVAKVRQDDCAACGLCLLVCPEEAIHFAPSKRTIGERIDMGKMYY
jgi:dihydropyrimidine dehydrogenase (NAD+) subunit PreA